MSALHGTDRRMVVEDMEKWARTFRIVGSVHVADLLDKARETIAGGESDPALAAELIACAATRERLPEQRSAARLMLSAAQIVR